MPVHFIVFPQLAHLVSHFIGLPQAHLPSFTSTHFIVLWQLAQVMDISPQRTSLPHPVHFAAMSSHFTS
jgi:hypothetical protein